MPAPAVVVELVSRFALHLKDYKSGAYHETRLRRDFLDPLFKVLGWDMDNSRGLPEQDREVVHEDRVRVGTALKAPDYGFRVGRQHKFFLEAKKPSVRIKDEASPAYQLRRYAWSAKLGLSILTDFEEFAVYDGRSRPTPEDPASKARLFYCTYTEYAEKWDWIASMFSREAVVGGSLEQFVATIKTKRGTAEVDDDFLSTIEGWRADLARVLALRNPRLSERELNFAVQCILDRIIFLRICEDRGIEDYKRLHAAAEGPGIYGRLVELFRQADDRYNSGLFHFKAERGRGEQPDALTPALKVDDDLLRGIIHGLYYPDSPYAFSVLGADILGQVYEQFLGKVIHLTAGHRAVVEDKPEVKKAGGVFYTPTYIVDSIVRKTIGPLLDGKTPKQIGKVRVIDPACGSGSFLIGAYQFMLDWYHRWYSENDPQKWARGRSPALVAAAGGGWHLTTAERKRILLTHIFGVDIDAQAVEVTKLSLLLKVLEGETAQTLQRELIQERVLPDLAGNIKCGNSLIGPDFLAQSGLPAVDLETCLRINPFDWRGPEGFGEVLAEGGFDAVIGNPPYVDVKELPGEIKAELSRKFRSATQRFDLYIPFMELGVAILSKRGRMGVIVPSMFMRREYGAALRGVIGETGRVEEVTDFGTNQIFRGSQNYVAIVVLSRSGSNEEVQVVRFDRTGIDGGEIRAALDGRAVDGVARFTLPASAFATDAEWKLLDRRQSDLAARLFASHPAFETMVRFASEGIHSGKDEVFFVPRERAEELGLESPPTFALAKGKDIHRYEDVDSKSFAMRVIYPYQLDSGEVWSEAELKRRAPRTWKYLCSSREALKGRAYFDKSSKEWYELWCPRDPTLYTSPKLVGPEIANKGEFTISRAPLFINNKLKSIVLAPELPESLLYVLGLLNSRLLTYLHRLIAPPKGNNYFEVKTRILGRLPIRRIDRKKKSDVAAHDEIAALVEQILAAHRQRADASTPHEQTALGRLIMTIEARIDRAVYRLYEVSEGEVELVERAG